MLQFAEQNQVALPIHDSFMMREGFAGDLGGGNASSFLR